MTRHVIDTHALAWFLTGSTQLGAAAKAALDAPDSSLILPAIVLAELCWMIEHGRIRVGPLDLILDRLRNDRRITVDPLDRELVEWTTKIGWNGEMHDRQIVCTALRASSGGNLASVLTNDAEIRSSGLVTIVW